MILSFPDQVHVSQSTELKPSHEEAKVSLSEASKLQCFRRGYHSRRLANPMPLTFECRKCASMFRQRTSDLMRFLAEDLGRRDLDSRHLASEDIHARGEVGDSARLERAAESKPVVLNADLKQLDSTLN